MVSLLVWKIFPVVEVVLSNGVKSEVVEVFREASECSENFVGSLVSSDVVLLSEIHLLYF